MRQLLRAHGPMPAFLIDASWNLLRRNRGGKWLAATLLPWATDLPEQTPMNMLDLLTHPEGFTRHMLKLPEVGPALLAHLRAEAAAQPVLTAKVAAFAALLEARLGTQSMQAGMVRPGVPVLTTRFATAYGELAFFSMFTTFGTPHDITLASLRIEHMFPADDATRSVITTKVG